MEQMIIFTGANSAISINNLYFCNSKYNFMDNYLPTKLFFQDSQKDFRYLYDKYVAMLRYFAAKYIDDDTVIEDVVQDAFLSLWEKRKDFREENAAKAYLYKVVRSFCIDKLRHSKARQRYTMQIAQNEEAHEFFLDNIIEKLYFF